MVKSDKKGKKNSAAEGIYGGFTICKIRRLIRRAVIFPADFRCVQFVTRMMHFSDTMLNTTFSVASTVRQLVCISFLQFIFTFSYSLVPEWSAPYQAISLIENVYLQKPFPTPFLSYLIFHCMTVKCWSAQCVFLQTYCHNLC